MRHGGGDALSEIALDRLDLGQQACRLSVEPEDMDLAIHAFGDREDRFVQGVAGDGEFLLESSDEF
jgi:hypothetical protein